MAKRSLVALGVCLWLLTGTNAWAEQLQHDNIKYDPVNAVISSDSYQASNTEYIYYVSGGEVEIRLYKGPIGAVVVPETIEGMPVVSIGSYAFSNDPHVPTNVTSVTLPDSVRTIKKLAFFYADVMTSVTLGNGVLTIGDDAFGDCWALTGITIPDSVISIGTSAFKGCENLTTVILGESLAAIGDYAFDGCYKLANATIPGSVTEIGAGAFRDCALTSVTIPNGVTSIEDYTFSGCMDLTSVTISDSVTEIGAVAFSSSALTDITIPNSVTTIGDNAFSGCWRLASVTSIGPYAFGYCDRLTVAYFLGDAPSMGSSVFAGPAPDFTVCYTSAATGFTTPTWEGYPAAPCACSNDIDCAAGETCVDGACEVDSDSDAVIDTEDNCPDMCNPLQLDGDGDGIGDVCDPTPSCGGCGLPVCEVEGQCDDSDNDEIADFEDNCLDTCNYQQLDADEDGIGDVCDPTPLCGGGCGLPDCEEACTP